MRATTLLLALALALAFGPAASAETITPPHNAWVTSDHGVNVRREAEPQSPVVAVLWKGARVFVRDASGPYVRIDGYGVAGYAYVDATFIGDQPPAPPVAPATAAPATSH